MEIKRARTVRIPVNNQKERVDKQRFRKKLCHTQKKSKNHLSGKKNALLLINNQECTSCYK